MSGAMKRFFLILVLISSVAIGCTERNANQCRDGICVDPARPYCDIEGSFEGTPNTCIAVECTAGEFVACRGDIELSCNAAGTTYTRTECAVGCASEANGCRQCADATHCSADAPICDAETSACRGCTSDDECASAVCDVTAGRCIDESSVVYASATAASGSCSRAQPCSLRTAYVTAANAAVAPTIRMLPGTYTEATAFDVPTVKPIAIVATGATMAVIGDIPAIRVDRGADVAIRGLNWTSQRFLKCGSANAATSSVAITRTSSTGVGSAARFEITRCRLSLDDARLDQGDTVLALLDDADVALNRVHVPSVGRQSTLLFANASRVKFRATNSLFEDVEIAAFLADTAAPGTSLTFSHSTLIQRSHPVRLCDMTPSAYFQATFENSVIVSQGAFDAIDAGGSFSGDCTFVKTLLSRQAATPDGTFVADPLFADEQNRNYELTAASPAVDAAVAASVAASNDLKGISRPRGVAADLGAYERIP